MASEGRKNDFTTVCKLVERLVDESAVLFLVLPDGRELELDRRRPGSRIDEEGLDAIARLIEMEVKGPILQAPSSGELGGFGFDAWRGIQQRLHQPGHDPDGLMPLF